MLYFVHPYLWYQWKLTGFQVVQYYRLNSLTPNNAFNASIAFFGIHGATSNAKLCYVDFSRKYDCLVVLIKRLLDVQINSNVAYSGKSHNKTCAYQVYAWVGIKYTRVFEGLICIFALNFEMWVVQTANSERIIK